MPTLPDHLKSPALGRDQISREVLSEHQRERVLVSATAVFAKRGYQGATVDDILAAGKVGVTNFYSLFEGKEDCFLAAYERILGNGRRQIANATAGVEDWSEQAYLGLRALLEVFSAEPLEARLALVEAQSAGDAAIARYDSVLASAVEWLRRGRALYPAAAGLPSSFEQAAVSGLAFYLAQSLLGSAPRRSVDELLAETSGLLLEPIVGHARIEELRRHLSVA